MPELNWTDTKKKLNKVNPICPVKHINPQHIAKLVKFSGMAKANNAKLIPKMHLDRNTVHVASYLQCLRNLGLALTGK